MNYSLALWWWWAKGLAHIWIIKRIQEEWIFIDEVSWTSMWSIIWASFACWFSYSKIYDIISSISFIKLFDLNLKTWIVKWNKVREKILEIFWDLSFEDIDISLKIVATDLDTWKKNVFASWSIVDAIMASISIPAVFKPYTIWNKTYVDWGLSSNLPVNDLEWNNIIAVSVLRWELPKIKENKKLLNFDISKSFFTYNYEIIHNSFYILMCNNEDLDISIAEKCWKNITFIWLPLIDYEFYDFYKFDKIISIWYENSKKII